MDSQEKPRERARNISSHLSPFDTVTQLDHTNVFCPNMMDLQQLQKVVGLRPSGGPADVQLLAPSFILKRE